MSEFSLFGEDSILLLFTEQTAKLFLSSELIN